MTRRLLRSSRRVRAAPGAAATKRGRVTGCPENSTLGTSGAAHAVRMQHAMSVRYTPLLPSATAQCRNQTEKSACRRMRSSGVRCSKNVTSTRKLHFAPVRMLPSARQRRRTHSLCRPGRVVARPINTAMLMRVNSRRTQMLNGRHSEALRAERHTRPTRTSATALRTPAALRGVPAAADGRDAARGSLASRLRGCAPPSPHRRPQRLASAFARHLGRSRPSVP